MVSLTYVGLLYDRTEPLRAGTVVPNGIDLRYDVPDTVAAHFRRLAQEAEIEVAEMSMSTYMMLRDRGDDRLVALPVFPSRVFRHSFVFVNTGSRIERPEDLAGRKVGVMEYQMTAALWIRAFLEHDYGVRPRDVDWRYGGLDTPAYVERLAHEPPAGVRLERIPADRTLDELLHRGELDALASARVPACFRAGNANVRRLFPDYRTVELDYFERTGFFPIMHVVVMARRVYEREPWIAVSLLEAFVEAKRRAFAAMRELGALAVSLPWLGHSLEEVDAVFEGDPFPYGFGANRAILEAMADYSYEQGLSSRRLTPAHLFASETLQHAGG
jgi:4,5-dihydroxyphthalate decarboxylase